MYAPHQTGFLGEKWAQAYIKKKGFTILDTNWKNGFGEIDIIAKDGPVLVFIEVKTRKTNSLVKGYYAVNRKKKEILRKTCKQYIHLLSKKPKHYRFDVIEVELTQNNNYTIQHYPNVLLFTKHFYIGR